MNNSGITSDNNNGIAFIELTAAENHFEFANSISTALSTSEAELSEIEYIQPGNHIRVPVDYVRSVTMVREELYD
jgi:hypothetical protein